MENWHERNCRRPDVVVIDTMPTCMSCGSFYNRDYDDDTTDRGELRKGVSEFEETPAYLNLNWPSTVEFSSPDEVQDANIKDTLKQLGNMLEDQREQHQDHGPRNTIDVSSTSSGISTHGEMAQEVGSGVFFVSISTEKSQGRHIYETSSPATSLVYGSLTGADEIRLLHLSPRKSADDQILHGTLESTRLSMRPEFTAVSYTWADSDGNRSLSEDIFLGDPWIPLPITPNCAAALRRLRSGHQVLTFWIDSICINQLSTDEKSHQVRLMRDIFSRATSVAIFLGADKDAQDTRLLKRTSESLFYSGNQEDIIWDAVHDHVAVRTLFDRPYWSRVWVVQEVLLSKRAIVVLGETAVPLQSLLKARLLEHDGSTRLFSVPPWLQLGRALPIGDFHGLSKLLTETSTCLATDPKDMVFALLGLVQGAHLEGLVADYSKSIQEIRVGIASYFLIRHGQINILKSAVFDAQPNERLIPGSPSWVPSWDPDSHSKQIFADSIDAWCWTDLKRSILVDDWARMLRCYCTIRPGGTGTTALRHSRSNASSFRVLKGTGALLVGAYPLLRIDPSPFRGAFKYRSVANRSALLTPSASVARWGIYAARQDLDRDLEFGKPGDWLVEIPGCDDFFLLRKIPLLPGAYRISAICGLAIAVSFVDVWLPDGEMTQPTVGSDPPNLSNDELNSRLIIFDPHQLQFLEDWEVLAPCGTTLGPSSEKSDSSRTESSTSLSENDMRQYAQWGDRISDNPLRATQPTSFEDTLEKVAIYLDRWQDLDLWDRIVSKLEAVSWASLLEAVVQIRSGLMSKHPPEDQAAGIKHDQTFPAAEILKTMIAKLRNLLLELTSRGTSLQPAGIIDTLRALSHAVDEADTSTILEVFKTNEDEIEKNLKKLESHLEFMRDSLPRCYGIRDKFSQRHLLKHLYSRSELRNFLIY